MKFKRLRQAAAWALAVFMFLFSPVCDYAGAVEACAEVASGSDAKEAGEGGVLGLPELEELPESDEPFYYDENGNKVYDSEIEFPVMVDDYSDIAWTFEEYPETFMGSAQTYSVTLTSAALYVVVAILALFGIKISVDAARDFVANGFEPWLRRTKGAIAADMKLWQDFVKLEVAVSFVGMKRLVELFREYFDSSASVGDSSIEVPLVASNRFEVQIPNDFRNSLDYIHVGGNYFINKNGNIDYRDVYVKKTIYESTLCAYVTDVYNGNNSYHSSGPCYGINFLNSNCSSSDLSYVTNTFLSAGYWSSTKELGEPFLSSYYFTAISLSDALALGFPVFYNKTAAESYIKFGTTGNMLKDDSDKSMSIPINGVGRRIKRDAKSKLLFHPLPN